LVPKRKAFINPMGCRKRPTDPVAKAGSFSYANTNGGTPLSMLRTDLARNPNPSSNLLTHLMAQQGMSI